MEFVKQLWQHSFALRVVLCVAAAGIIFGVATADRSESVPQTNTQMEAPEVFGELKKRIPGMGDTLPAKAGRAANKTVDVVEGAIDTATKAVGIVDSVVEKTAEETESVRHRKK